MDTVQISVKPRLLSGSDVAKKVRRAGLLPAVMYGQGAEARHVALDPKPLKRGLQSGWGRNQLFTVSVEGEQGEQLAITKEVQLHPVTRELKHVDLYLVQPDSPIQVTLPIQLSGRSAGQKAGGRLEFITRYVKVACTPRTLPRLVEIDVTPFENGTVMTVDDLPLPDGVKPVYKRSFKILEVLAPKVEEKPVEEKKGKK